jgi:hypothetical protein
MKSIKLVKTENPHGIPMTFYRPDRDGVTFSLLTKFKNCRERARLHLRGWTSSRVSLSMLFGSLIHACLERIYGDIQLKRLKSLPTPAYIDKHLKVLEKEWRRENPKASAETVQDLELAIMLIYVVLPVYFKWWAKDLTTIKWHALEHQFKMPLPELGTFLRGVMDGRYSSKGRERSNLFETKSKSRLGEQGESNIVDILGFELQVNLYLAVIWFQEGKVPGGLCYNIIRRPNLQKKKSETFQMFQRRIEQDVKSRPDHYFIRLRMDVDRRELEREGKEHHALIRDFMQWYHGEVGHYKNSDHCENKYGTCEFIQVCSGGNYTGLYKRPKVFRELEDV